MSAIINILHSKVLWLSIFHVQILYCHLVCTPLAEPFLIACASGWDSVHSSITLSASVVLVCFLNFDAWQHLWWHSQTLCFHHTLFGLGSSLVGWLLFSVYSSILALHSSLSAVLTLDYTRLTSGVSAVGTFVGQECPNLSSQYSNISNCHQESPGTLWSSRSSPRREINLGLQGTSLYPSREAAYVQPSPLCVASYSLPCTSHPSYHTSYLWTGGSVGGDDGLVCAG